MRKDLLLTAYYLYMIYQFNTGEDSAFMMLFSLLIELVLILLVFIIFSYRSGNKKYNVGLAPLIGIMPLLMFQYFITWTISSFLKEFPPNTELGIYAPVNAFKSSILISLVFLLIIYGVNVYELIVKKHSIGRVRKSVMFQAIVVTVTSLIGIIILSVMDKGMAAGRVLFEILVNKLLSDIGEDA